jgi:outer membrane lipoprotein-sorting protein
MMNHKKMIIFYLICVSLIVIGFFVWFSENEAERKAQEYMKTFEEMGCSVEEYPFSTSHTTGTLKLAFFSDFRSFATQNEIERIYCDHEINALYFYHPIQEYKVEIVVFYYS